MKRRGQTTPYAVRVRIGELASEGKTDAEIAIALGDNYWTVRKWRRRFQQHGKAGLVSTMGATCQRGTEYVLFESLCGHSSG